MPKKPRLTLQQHAAMVELLARVEQDWLKMCDATRGTPVTNPVHRRVMALEVHLQKLRSALEGELYREHPEAARAAGFPHYNLAPELGEAARRFIAAHGTPASP